MNPRRAARGQPLLVLGLILSTWVGARVAIVTSADEAPVQPAAFAERSARTAPSPALVPAGPAAQAESGSAANNTGMASEELVASVWAAPAPVAVSAAPLLRPSAADAPIAPVAAAGVPARVAAGHQLLWMAAVSLLPSPQEATAFAAQKRSALALTPTSTSPAPRWSADGWLLWRRGGAGATGAGFAPSTYGASQAGAVLRYRLAPDSSHRPALYLRGTTALEQPRGEEVALGLSARPLANVPVAAMVEARATRFAGATKVRPAAALVTEIPPFRLPAKARGELYVQAGYVGGAGATGFVDGSLQVDRPLFSLGKAELRAGGGVWGGAQKGASRLDLGPGVTLGLPLSDKASARVAADWRFRVAGSAAPASGPAVTLSAGF